MRTTPQILVAAVAALALLWIAPAITQAQDISAPELTAVAGEDAIELSWNEIENAVRYQLWAWNEAGGWQLLGDALTVTSYRHDGLEEGVNWYYTIRAVDAQGQSGPWAEYVTATAVTPTPTATPSSPGLPTLTPTAAATPTALAAQQHQGTSPTSTATPTDTATPAPTHSATPTKTPIPMPTVTPTPTEGSSTDDSEGGGEEASDGRPDCVVNRHSAEQDLLGCQRTTSAPSRITWRSTSTPKAAKS